MSEDQDEYDVAVVVFGRARGADAEDAEDVLKLAVRRLLAEATPPVLPHQVSVAFRPDREPLEPLIVDVAGIRYTGQFLRLVPTNRAYRDRGLDSPRKAGA